MAPYEDERLAVSARYIAVTRDLGITLDDDSRHLMLPDDAGFPYYADSSYCFGHI